MDKAFFTINSTVNKSAIKDFKVFLQKYTRTTKWYVCSDYCFDDVSKKNDVVSFVIYPHDIDINLKQRFIQSLQSNDLKNTRTINPAFCQFLHSGTFFSFNFILEKDNFFNYWKGKDLQQHLVDTYIEMVSHWIVTTPKNEKIYTEYAGRLRKFRNNMSKKSFNCKLFARILMVVFLAGYIKYLLLQEHQNVHLYSWLSDRDAIIEWEDNIGEVFYHIISHCLCTNCLSNPTIEDKVKEVYFRNNEHEQFYDQLNRVADYICGTLADFDYKIGSVTAKKQCIMIEDALADNSFIINLGIANNEVKRVTYKKPDT